ncbi:MAG: hypothetical protein JW881_21025 [Spirochaetales bacterium]|nr:hypothetical protein [Spirochaetales bacterium]
MKPGVRKLILLALCTGFIWSCNDIFYNPFTENTYKGEDEVPTPGPTDVPTAAPTSEPTPAGSNETPENAEPVELVAGSAQVAADNTDANQAVTMTPDSCVGWTTEGSDLFYSIALTGGETITIIITPDGWDPALYLFTDALNPEGSCVAGAEDEGVDGQETIVYPVPVGEDGTYIIGVDSYFPDLLGDGPFTLDISVE